MNADLWNLYMDPMLPTNENNFVDMIIIEICAQLCISVIYLIRLQAIKSFPY